MKTVFYAWQSDLPNRQNRSFIERCLERAIEKINATVPPEKHLILDKDTQGVAGMPIVSEVIFAKIQSCAVFVGDLSFVTMAGEKRPSPNPNVLIELGYALASLGDRRIVALFNSAFGDTYDLPFDLRNRRFPLAYSVKESDSADTLSREREKLIDRLWVALAEAAKHAPNEPDAAVPAILPSHAAKPVQDYAFAIDGQIARTPARDDEGRASEYVFWHQNPSLWLRIVPHLNKRYRRAQLEALVRAAANPLNVLGGSRAREIALNEYGLIILGFDGNEPETIATRLSQVFLTGEIWGINRLILEPKRTQPRNFQIPWPEVADTLENSLANYLQFANETLGLDYPLSVIMGLAHVRDAVFLRKTKGSSGDPKTPRSFESQIVRLQLIREPGSQSRDIFQPLYEAIFEACGLDYSEEVTE